MSLKLHDTLSRSVREFVPIEPGRVLLYQCGATVQSAPHVGHVRSGVAFDLLCRWLRVIGYDVVLCRNVTDVDDKILRKAEIEQRPWWAVAAHYEREFQTAYEALGCTQPTVEPRATGHITQMVELMDRLISAGHAYASGGDVYFDVGSYQQYGQLSRQRLDELLPATDSDVHSLKRDPRDFTLWKSAKPGEPHWPTPWGPGRPGWHLECSAMASAYLGPVFDIHGGGLDLVFPHHENELAQSRAAGEEFARYWVHNAWVTTAGEKMSKSLGNSLVVSQVLTRVRPVELRWYLVSAHYRSNLEFSDDALAEAAASYRRVEGFVTRASSRAVGLTEPSPMDLPEPFVAAMNDDLAVPAGLAILHEAVTAGNRALAADDDDAVIIKLKVVRAMLDVLGVDPLSAPWVDAGATGDATHAALDRLVSVELQAREAARSTRDFATADAIRDRLVSAGLDIEDATDGSRWSLAGES